LNAKPLTIGSAGLQHAGLFARARMPLCMRSWLRLCVKTIDTSSPEVF